MRFYFYYLTFFLLVFQGLYSAFVVIVSPIQLWKLRRERMKIKGANRFVLMQLLQAAVVLSISIILLNTLRSGQAPVEIIFVAMLLLSLADTFVRRYHNSRSSLATESNS
jgi:hypothetical protein